VRWGAAARPAPKYRTWKRDRTVAPEQSRTPAGAMPPPPRRPPPVVLDSEPLMMTQPDLDAGMDAFAGEACFPSQPASQPGGGLRRKFAAILDDATPLDRFQTNASRPSTLKRPDPPASRRLAVHCVAAATPASDDIPRRVGVRPRNQVLDSTTPAARFKRRKLVEVEDDDSSSAGSEGSLDDADANEPMHRKQLQRATDGAAAMKAPAARHPALQAQKRMGSLFVEDEASVSDEDGQAADEEDLDGPDEYEADFIDVATQPGGGTAKGHCDMMAIYHKSLNDAATPLTGLRAFQGRRRPLRQVADTPEAHQSQDIALQDSPCLTDDSFIVTVHSLVSPTLFSGIAQVDVCVQVVQGGDNKE
ncbi:hypothetical protein WJX84_001059, partial [Apatococcus fuscideae]